MRTSRGLMSSGKCTTILDHGSNSELQQVSFIFIDTMRGTMAQWLACCALDRGSRDRDPVVTTVLCRGLVSHVTVVGKLLILSFALAGIVRHTRSYLRLFKRAIAYVPTNSVFKYTTHVT